MSTLRVRAEQFAEKKHAGQTRRFEDDVPYVDHPRHVADIVAHYTDDEEIYAAALLHDTLEDTDTFYGDLVDQFGRRVADLVLELTNDEDEIIRIGKAEYLSRKMNAMSMDAYLIKLADRLDNLGDVAKGSKNFSSEYLSQSQYILSHLKHECSVRESRLLKRLREKTEEMLSAAYG